MFWSQDRIGNDPIHGDHDVRATTKLVAFCFLGMACTFYNWKHSSNSSNAGSVGHFIAAMKYRNEAAKFGNKECPEREVTTTDTVKPACYISEDDWKIIEDFDSKALAEAKQVDIAALNNHYPGFGDHFRDEFMEGLSLILHYNRSTDTFMAFLNGQILLDKFADWYSPNFEKIRQANSQTP